MWIDKRVIQYSTVQYSTVQYSTVQYSTVQYSTVQYSTVQYSTVQYSTVQYSTVQYSTVQYSTVQYSTAQYSKYSLKFLYRPICSPGLISQLSTHYSLCSSFSIFSLAPVNSLIFKRRPESSFDLSAFPTTLLPPFCLFLCLCSLSPCYILVPFKLLQMYIFDHLDFIARACVST